MQNAAPSTLRFVLDRLDQLTYDELVYLNQEVVERIKLVRQAKTLVDQSQFRVNDRVEFTNERGQIIRGTIIRLNTKSATVQTDASGNETVWRVSPSLLRRTTG